MFTDVLVVGSGVAGISASLAAARHGRVLLASKSSLEEGNTRWAQGGIAAALGGGDSPDAHLEDTMAVGLGLCDPEVVRVVVEEAPERIRALLGEGVRFDRTDDGFRLGREGGHGHARIVHAGGDATGSELERGLLARVAAEPRVRTRDRLFLLDLLSDSSGNVVGGAFAGASGETVVVRAGSVILASGGACRIYRESTNSPVATGDGIAAAFRAGASVADAEFVQFHPTVLYAAGAARYLVTEAVRGAGARLVDRSGNRFMEGAHPLGDLAPRDVVVRAILQRLRETGDTHVFLDMRHLPGPDARERFPGVFRTCASVGLDPTRDPIPVRPSAHYFLGGVATRLDGTSDVPGLYACGEAAASGLHGANRLASNSLLEGLVLGTRAGDAAGSAAARRPKDAAARAPEPLPSPGPAAGDLDIDDLSATLRSLMGRRAGPERDGAGLADAARELDGWGRFLCAREFRDVRGWELQNMLLVSRLVVAAARLREESRGTHRRSDFPERDDVRWKVRVFQRQGRTPSRVAVGGKEEVR